eukprot:Nk52_evm10s2579 gene=Nk52_evmTU10s2579
MAPAIMEQKSDVGIVNCEKKSLEVSEGTTVEYVEKLGLRNLTGAQTLIFVHEIGGSWRSFERILNLWSNTHNLSVYVIDLNSISGPAAASVQDLGKTVAAFINKLVIRKCILIGNSTGSLVAYFAGAECPAVKKLVLSGMSGQFGNNAKFNEILSFVNGKEHFSEEDAVEFFSKTSSTSGNSPQDFKDMLKKEFASRKVQTIKNLLESVKAADLAACGSKIGADCLLLRGSTDQFVSEEEVKLVESHLTKCEYSIVKGSGHTVFWDQLNAVTTLLLETGKSIAAK